MKKRFVFIFSIFMLILGIYIKKRKNSKKKCEKLIYYYKNLPDCSGKKCNKKKQDYNNNVFKVCKNELIKWYKSLSKENYNFEEPKTFNQKIQWLKIYDNNPLKTQLSDKYLVRGWIKKMIGEKYLVKLLGVWDSFDEINFELLPNRFVLKTNHGTSNNIIVEDKSKLNITDARNKMNKWIKKNYAFYNGFELQYLNIKPKIIAEEYLENDNGDINDYKVFCFDGKAESIMFLSERKKNLKMSFYDLKWNKLNYVYSFQRNNETAPKPKNLDLLIQLSEKLSKGFPHVRVDFYILNDGTIKFGEMTFTSYSGLCKWDPPEINLYLGNLIKLPSKNPFTVFSI